MSNGTITQFHLSLRLSRGTEIANMPPSSYWGITVAQTKAARDPFADQEAFLALVEGAAGRAAAKAVRENDELGLPTPVRGKDGNVAFRLRGEIVAKNE